MTRFERIGSGSAAPSFARYPGEGFCTPGTRLRFAGQKKVRLYYVTCTRNGATISLASLELLWSRAAPPGKRSLAVHPGPLLLWLAIYKYPVDLAMIHLGMLREHHTALQVYHQMPILCDLKACSQADLGVLGGSVDCWWCSCCHVLPLLSLLYRDVLPMLCSAIDVHGSVE